MKKGTILVMFVLVCIATMISNGGVNASGKCEVRFTFDGLQVLAFGDTDRVTNGILDVHHHTPKVEIKQIENGKEKVIASIEGKELYKKTLNVGIPNNMHKPTRYYSTNMSKDKQDFRWCLDIENDLFQKELYLKQEKFYCKVNFEEGEFFTDHVTEDKYQFVTNTKIHAFNREIGAPATRIELQAQDKLVINGLDKELSLPYRSGVSYQVNITNLPPTAMMNMDHFSFYYDVLKADVPKFMPSIVKKAAFPRPFACEAIVLGKSKM